MSVEGDAAEATPAPPGSADQLLEALYRRYGAWLGAKLKRHYGQGAADDLVHETYIRLAPYRDGREIRHPRALLWKIAQNLARNHHRRLRGAPIGVDSWEDSVDHGLVQAASQFESALLQELVLNLAPPLRQTFLLSRFSGMSNTEIALHCDVSVATVERRLAKALAQCARHMAG